MKTKKRAITLLFVFFLLLQIGLPTSAPAQKDGQAASATTLSLVGRLTKPDATSVPDGVYDIRFTAFADPDGGKEVWAETVTGVKVRRGTFSVLLGKEQPLPPEVCKGTWYVEIQVGKEQAVTRQPLKTDISSIKFLTNSSQPAVQATFSVGADVAPIAPLTHKGKPSEAAGVIARMTTAAAPNCIAVSGRYTYVGTASTGLSPMQVIDISDPHRPSIVATLDLLSESELPPGGCSNWATWCFGAEAIAVSGKYVYVHLWSLNNESKLKVVDVSDPSRPFVAASLGIGFWATRFVVSGEYIYVRSQTLLRVISVKEPKAPTLVGTLEIPGAPFQSLAKAGNYVYAVGENLTVIGSGLLHVIDVSNPQRPVLVSSMVTASQPASIRASDGYVYLTNWGGGRGPYRDANLQIIDVRNPARPVEAGVVASTVGQPRIISIDGSQVYVMDDNLDVYEIVDVSNPARPSVVSTVEILDITGSPIVGTMSGGYFYNVISSYNVMRVLRFR